MATYTVRGGAKLAGIYEVSGAKNAGPKLIIATMLSDKPCTLRNIPRISDTEKIMEAIVGMGGECSWTGEHEVRVDCANLNNPNVPECVLTARHAVLFIGATLARLGEVKIAKIGGDYIGKRPIDRLVSGLESIGAKFKYTDISLEMEMPEQPLSRDYTFAKNTCTGTESLLLGSIFNDGKVVIHNAAAEPEVDNLIEFLNAMGAKVTRSHERIIEVTGVPKFLGGATGESVQDRLEAATAITIAVMNEGEIEVVYSEPTMIQAYSDILESVGIRLEWQNGKVKVEKSTSPLKPAFVKTSVHPGFMTDWQPIITLLLATKASGKSEIHEMIFEQRWSSLRELAKMGVRYELFNPPGYTSTDFNFNETEFNAGDPYGAYVWGPTKLIGAKLQSHDVRAGMTVLLAALFAKGTSIIYDPDNHIERGYEDIVGKLAKLGANITKT